VVGAVTGKEKVKKAESVLKRIPLFSIESYVNLINTYLTSTKLIYVLIIGFFF